MLLPAAEPDNCYITGLARPIFRVLATFSLVSIGNVPVPPTGVVQHLVPNKPGCLTSSPFGFKLGIVMLFPLTPVHIHLFHKALIVGTHQQWSTDVPLRRDTHVLHLPLGWRLFRRESR